MKEKMSVVNPSQKLSYWALHTTHTLVSLIGVAGLLGLAGLDAMTAIYTGGRIVILDSTALASVWIVGLPLFGYFVSKISVNAQGLQENTGSPSGQATSTAS